MSGELVCQNHLDLIDPSSNGGQKDNDNSLRPKIHKLSPSDSPDEKVCLNQIFLLIFWFDF